MHPPELKRLALQLYARGRSLRDIAAELRVSITALWRWAGDAGFIRDRGTSIRLYHRNRPASELVPFRAPPRGPRRKGGTHPLPAHPFTQGYPWASDSAEIRAFVEMAWKDRWLPSSIVSGRGILKRYEAYVHRRFRTGLDPANPRAFVAYRTHLVRGGKKRSTQQCYLETIVAYYRLKAENSQDQQDFDGYTRIRAFGRVYKPMGDHWEPFSLDTLQRILSAAYCSSWLEAPGHPAKEDYPLLMTLLYTGGRAQFYGLKVRELDFDKMEIRTRVKGGRALVIPLHPTLAKVLREHLRNRPYRSEFVFQSGMSSRSHRGISSNQNHAWAACKRVQEAAQVQESVHPSRFRVTFASLGRRLGIDPELIQAILGHRHLGTTLDVYSRMQPDEARDAFSKVRLTRNLGKLGSRPTPAPADAWMRRIPQDTTEAANTFLQGLVALTQGTSAHARTVHPQVRKFRQLHLPEGG